MSEREPQSFGEHVRIARAEKGLTLHQVAKETGMSFSTIHKIEHGLIRKPRPANAEKLSSALGFDWDYVPNPAREKKERKYIKVEPKVIVDLTERIASMEQALLDAGITQQPQVIFTPEMAMRPEEV